MAAEFVPLVCPTCGNKVGVRRDLTVNASCAASHRPVLMQTKDGKPYHSPTLVRPRRRA